MQHLNDLKRKHSKSAKLRCDDLKQAEYIKSKKFTLREKKLLFKLRSRTLDVKQNFKNQHRDPWCGSCGLFQETQSHLLQCPKIVTKLNYLRGKTAYLNENDIYGDIKKQEVIIRIYSDILEIREELRIKAIE